MIVRREIWNERESATEIDVDGAWCNEYETNCLEPVDDKVDEQCVIVALNSSFIPYFAWSCYRTV